MQVLHYIISVYQLTGRTRSQFLSVHNGTALDGGGSAGLFTFVLDYAGGTYLKQVRAPNLSAAIKEWANHLDITPIKGMGPRAKELLTRDVIDEKPVAIEGLINTWCLSCRIRNKLALIHIVKTESSQA